MSAEPSSNEHEPGIIWINHHAMIRILRRVDHSILIWNLVLLMTVAVLPFTTALMAQCLKEAQGESLAAAVYSGSLLLMGLAFAGMNHHVLFRRSQFLGEEIDAPTRRLTLKRETRGLAPYLVATLLAPLTPYLTLAICGATALYYALPATSSTEPVEPSGEAPA